MPKRFNEAASPPVKSRRVMAIQILRQLYHNQETARDAILTDLGITEGDLVETMEILFQQAIDREEIEECGVCGHYHRPDFRGDCRNDDERFPGW